MRRRVHPLLPVAALALACAHEAVVRAPDEVPPAPRPAAAPRAPVPAPPAAPPAPPRPPAQRSGAAKAPAGGGVARAEPGPGEYFPLAVGNEWNYVDESPALPAERRGVVRTVRILDRTPDGFFRDNQRGELRVDGACVRDRLRRLLCQPFQPGASWSSVVSVSSIERYEIAAVHEVVETPAGRFEGCVRVRAHNRASAGTDHVLEITYAPGVGPVRIETYVVVDGKVTPQVRAMLRSYRLEGR
jgi:hypothetical protein